MTAICTKCQRELDVSEFRHGRKSCRDCENNIASERKHRWYVNNRDRLAKQGKLRYANNKDHISEINRRWSTNNADRVKENGRRWRQNNLERNHERARQWREKNKDKLKELRKSKYTNAAESAREKSRQWRKDNPERSKEQWRRWRENNKERNQEQRTLLELRRRATKLGAHVNDLTSDQWRAIQSAFDHCCAYCHKRMKGKLTQDHITALSKGGNHTSTNIVPACTSCNSRKRTGPPPCPVQPLLLV